MHDDPVIGVDDRALDDAALEALAEAHATAPPGRLRARLLEAARHDAVAQQAANRLRRWRLVGSIAAVAVLALATLLVRASRLAAMRGAEIEALARGNAALVARLDEQDQALTGLRRSVAAQGDALKVLAAPQTITATLTSGAAAGGAAGARVLVDAASGDAAVVVSGLPPAAAGRTYELWAIRGDRPPEPAGLFTVGPEATLVTRVDRVPRPREVTAFAVSIEPAGGSTSPTGTIVLSGAVAS